MADHFAGLHLIPEHMRDSVVAWIERGDPEPRLIGSFFYAFLTNNLFDAFARADEENAAAMRMWCMYFYNFAPSQCFGSAEKVREWHARGGLQGIEKGGV